MMIQRRLRFSKVSGEWSGVAATCMFGYDSADPFAVSFRFTDITWVFSRDLFAVGITEGFRKDDEDRTEAEKAAHDVWLEPVSDGVEITLDSPSGTAVLLFDHDELFDALDATRSAVPEGSEHKFYDLDREIAFLRGSYDY